jgi:hypothetical protein
MLSRKGWLAPGTKLRHLNTMLHMMKLAVGVRDPAHLRALQAERALTDAPLQHRTRHLPRRAAEIVGEGSLFWVIGGTMLVRQRIIGIEPATRLDGTACAAILLDPDLVAVTPRPVKAFQGWRYLKADDAPADLDLQSAEADLPFELAQRLRELCLL